MNCTESEYSEKPSKKFLESKSPIQQFVAHKGKINLMYTWITVSE